MTPSGRTRVFAILGDPVAHSLSPAMHNAAFRMLGLDAVYVALRTAPGEVGGLMRALAAAGGGGNVTVPYKFTAAERVDEMRGPLPGACNTFWADGDRLVGDNTDVTGILDGLAALEAPATSWLLLGTGGSSQAVLAAARERGARVAVRSRSTDRMVAAQARMAELGVGLAAPEECQVVINATPLGLSANDPLPLTPFEAPDVGWALDLVYAPGATPFVHAFRERGVRAADGRGVLVAQGTAAFERWFGRRAPRDVMRAAVDAALG